MKSGKIILLLVMTTAILLAMSRCVTRKTGDPRGNAYAGSGACRSCHRQIFSSFAHTAHFLSARVASAQSVSGHFTGGSNSVQISAHDKISMEERSTGFFQVLYHNDSVVRSGKIDLVMGSVKGQTYLSENGQGYSELPASWLTQSSRWTASPGFSLDRMTFDRPVTRRCFECHSAYVPDFSTLPSGSDPETASVFSIDCERCHGPAAAHVQFHESNPQTKEPVAIVQISRLTRKQKMDLCASCHSGTRQTMLRSSFSFRPGDSLEKFMIPDFTGTMPVDVHGNQSRLLASSRCYLNSSLECNSCHNTHNVARGEMEPYNVRCRQCHAGNNIHGRLTGTVPESYLKERCTACHMPAQPSFNITMQPVRDSAVLAAMIVNHRIAVYPDVSMSILKRFRP